MKRKKQRLLMIVLAIVFVFTISVITTFASTADTCTLKVNGKLIATDVAPRFENDRVLVPVRALTDALGGEVKWDQITTTATLKYNGTTIELLIGSKTAAVNNESKSMDVPARIYSVNNIDRTLIPIRFVAENFGFNVDWDNNNRMVLVSTASSPEPSDTDLGLKDDDSKDNDLKDNDDKASGPKENEPNKGTIAGTITAVTLSQGSTDANHTILTITSNTILNDKMYSTGTLTEPSRLYIDFINFTREKNIASTLTLNNNSSAVNTVRTASTDNGSRVVIDLNESATVKPTITLSADKKSLSLAFPRIFEPWADGKLVVCLDPGHGSDTGGKRSPDSTLMEYEFNRAVAAKIRDHLVRHGIQVILTVPENNLKDISLEERCKLANASDADIFVSIHANAYGNGEWTTPKGWEIYTYQKGTIAERLAKAIQKATIPASGLTDRGVKTANFYVVKNTSMPAVLIEHGFYTNKTEVELLKSDRFREQLASYDAKGICDFLEVAWKNN